MAGFAFPDPQRPTMPAPLETFTVTESRKETILTALRAWMPGTSWAAARRLLHSRRIAINGFLCVDEARRVTAGEIVTVVDKPLPAPPAEDDVKIRFVDASVVVAEKPSGMLTVRHPREINWSHKRRWLQPTLDEIIPVMIAKHAAKKSNTKVRLRKPRLLSVHRIDRDTSGLVMFARNTEAQQHLISQFAAHKAVRKYLAIVPEQVEAQTIRSRLIRDRGDGIRGSTDKPADGQEAITHVAPRRQLGPLFELQCQLETGKTNQIRIHLAELGVPVCGDIKYRGPFGQPPIEDKSGIPRLALHAAELSFQHPTSKGPMNFISTWPDDIMNFLTGLDHPKS